MLLILLFRHGYRGGGANFDSAARMPLWAYVVTMLALSYIVIRLWIALRKDKTNSAFNRRQFINKLLMTKRTKITCIQGHAYYNTKASSRCPVCENENQSQ